MITNIRKQLLSPLTKIMIYIMVIGMLGLFSLPMMLKQDVRPWVFKVNGHPVDHMQFEHEVNDLRERIAYFRAHYGQFAEYFIQSMGLQGDPKMIAVDIMTKKILLEQCAAAIGLDAEESYVKNILHDASFTKRYLSDVVPAFLYTEEGRVNNVMVRSFLQRTGMSATSYLQRIKESLLRHTVLMLLEHATYMPEYEQKLFVKNQKGTKEIEILLLERSFFEKEERAQRTPSLDELKQFFDEKNKVAQTYYIPEKRSVTVWTFSPSDASAVSKEEIESYYHAHKSKKYVDQQAQVQVRQLIIHAPKEGVPSIAQMQEELTETPERFVEYAKQYSQEESAGQIVTLVYGTSNSPLYKGAFALQHEGEISPVIPYEEGFIIVQLVKKNARTYTPVSKVEKDIERTLRAEKFKEQFGVSIAPLLKDGIIDRDELKKLTELHHATVHKVQDIAAGQKEKDRIAKGAYAIEKEGNATFFVHDNKGIVLFLDAIQKKYLPSFESVQETVKNDWYVLQGALALQKAYKQVQETIATTSLETIARTMRVPLQKRTLQGMSDKKAIRDIESLGIQRGDIALLERVGETVSSMTSTSAYFVRCTGYEDRIENAALNKEEMQAIEEALAQSVIESLIASLYRGATIEKNESLSLSIEDYLV